MPIFLRTTLWDHEDGSKTLAEYHTTVERVNVSKGHTRRFELDNGDILIGKFSWASFKTRENNYDADAWVDYVVISNEAKI